MVSSTDQHYIIDAPVIWAFPWISIGMQTHSNQGILIQVQPPIELPKSSYQVTSITVNPDFIFGHSKMRLEPETIGIMRDIFGID